MTFARPLALVVLVAVPLLVAAWAWLERRRRAGAAGFTSPALLPNLVDAFPGRRRRIPQTLFLLALTALIVGMARPHAHITVPRHEATVVLAIDVSRSMSATDVKPSRLLAAEDVANAFVDRVPRTYNVAVVAFGTHAFVALPPTSDRALAHTAIDDLRFGEGTALGDAVSIAATLGERIRSQDGTVPPESVLLISDGARQGGKTPPLTAAARAKTLGVPVSAVLVGTPRGVISAKLVGGFSERIQVPPSPSTLQQIARTTGGEYFEAATAAQLVAVYKHLATRIGHRTENRELTDAFGAGALAFLLAGGGLSFLWFRRVLP
ncbi:MAG TPA: VWA domain-containing protein [Gaiellaceae bacterium]|nr:VWA domain-containing protein [Gaiellaceae bacterium]